MLCFQMLEEVKNCLWEKNLPNSLLLYDQHSFKYAFAIALLIFFILQCFMFTRSANNQGL